VRPEVESVQLSAPEPHRPRRGRRWRRWVAAVLFVLVALMVVAARVYLGSLSEPPLVLPSAADSPVGSTLDGTWTVGPGSLGGFRIEQTVLFMTSDVVGHTKDVSGSVVVSGDHVISGTFELDLTTITAGGKAQPQFGISLDTGVYPTATFRLEAPMAVPAGFASGVPVATTAVGRLTLHGTTREVTASVSGQRDGASILLVGSIPMVLADWGIEGPRGYGPLASVADHGSAEFLLVLRRP
jgi:polyisoprenoid-binding protein YceI